MDYYATNLVHFDDYWYEKVFFFILNDQTTDKTDSLTCRNFLYA